MIVTKEIIKAQKELLKQYKDENHNCSFNMCPTCKLFYDPGNGSKSCDKCYNVAFKKRSQDVIPCLKRHHSPKNSDILSRDEKDEVIRYHTAVLNYFVSIKGQEIDPKMLIEIDKQL